MRSTDASAISFVCFFLDAFPNDTSNIIGVLLSGRGPTIDCMVVVALSCF